MIFIVTYHSPDIDGIACLIAYSELLGKLGKKVRATYFGNLSLEVEFVKKFTKYFPVTKQSGSYPKDASFVLVDTADLDAIEPKLSPNRVIEVFDHRELVFIETFTNAKLNIEKVGSCATLIAEQFRKNRFVPSKNAAVYLYSAIISNTINFKNTVTTPRDISMATWLKGIAGVDDSYIKAMFEYKSKIENKEKLIFLIEQDFSTKELHNRCFGIAQIEVTNLNKVIRTYKDVIRMELQKLKKRKKLDYVLFTGIDIVDGFNYLITIDKESDKLFSKAFEASQINGEYQTDSIVMRKQIWPKIDKILE